MITKLQRNLKPSMLKRLKYRNKEQLLDILERMSRDTNVYSTIEQRLFPLIENFVNGIITLKHS